jgi:hypothetical protein
MNQRPTQRAQMKWEVKGWRRWKGKDEPNRKAVGSVSWGVIQV